VSDKVQRDASGEGENRVRKEKGGGGIQESSGEGGGGSRLRRRGKTSFKKMIKEWGTEE